MSFSHVALSTIATNCHTSYLQAVVDFSSTLKTPAIITYNFTECFFYYYFTVNPRQWNF